MMMYTRPHLRRITNQAAESPAAPEPQPADTLDEFEAAFSAIEPTMTRIVNDHVHGPLRSMVLEHLGTGGKFIRARIALRSAMALGLDPQDSVNVASACEFLHNATLVHDDLQDGDTVRRGHPTVWVKHGMAQAVNVGDVLLMLATLALENSPINPTIRWHLAAAMARRASETASGQALELVLLERGWMGRDTYLRAARGKTGPFFALPVEAAVLCAGHPPEHARLLGDATLALGALYQVCDDIMDLYGNKERGAIGNDIREGKVSALTVAHLEVCPEDEPFLLETLLRAREETTDVEVHEWAERFRDGGALRGARKLASQLLAQVDCEPALINEVVLHRLVTQTAQKLIAPLETLTDGEQT